MKLFKNIFLVLFFVGFSVHLYSQQRTADKIFSSESKILVISGHPNLEKSKANKAILKELEKYFGKQISIRRLDKLYPNYQINVKAEQEAIKNADFIILQFPLYWYGTPAILKKWIDDVLYNYFKGNRLSGKFKDKAIIASVTIGGSKERYSPPNKTVETYLIPLQETFEVIGAGWASPVYSFDAVPSNKNLSETAFQHFVKLIDLINEHKSAAAQGCW